jgi:hypothetical protein
MTRAMVVLGLLLGVCATANAQEAGQVGITMGYPGSIGVIWHVSDSVAVRPEVAFSTSSSNNEFSADSTTVNVGASGLFYMAKWEHVRAYVSPRFSYGHASSDSTGTIGIGLKNSTYNVVGSFGVQYTPHKRFAVFGETGVGYSRSTSSTTTVIIPIVLPPGLDLPTRPTTTSTLTGFNTRTGVGVIFYFK